MDPTLEMLLYNMMGGQQQNNYGMNPYNMSTQYGADRGMTPYDYGNQQQQQQNSYMNQGNLGTQMSGRGMSPYSYGGQTNLGTMDRGSLQSLLSGYGMGGTIDYGQPMQQTSNMNGYGGAFPQGYGTNPMGSSFFNNLPALGNMNPFYGAPQAPGPISGYRTGLEGLPQMGSPFFQNLAAFGPSNVTPFNTPNGGATQDPGLAALINLLRGGQASSFGGQQTAAATTPAYTAATTPAYTTGSVPIGADPALWAASGGQGGLTTQQGGYSQDPSFWQNMNAIASGTQTFTPWTQTVAPGVRAKPARSGFRGIPVPDENTGGYTTSNIPQPYAATLMGSIPSAAPTYTANTTPTIGNTGTGTDNIYIRRSRLPRSR